MEYSETWCGSKEYTHEEGHVLPHTITPAMRVRLAFPSWARAIGVIISLNQLSTAEKYTKKRCSMNIHDGS